MHISLTENLNEVINLTSEVIFEKHASGIREYCSYIIQFNEATDSTGKSQICFIFRYMLQSDVKEVFCGFVDAYEEAKILNYRKLEAKALAAIVLKFVEKLRLDKMKCIGICTNTCNLMTGSNSGTFVELKKTIPQISHFLCLNHISSLAILDSFKLSSDINNGLQLIRDLNSFFCSAKRIKELEDYLSNFDFRKLRGICFTRWSEIFQVSFYFFLIKIFSQQTEF